jgi:hypothetical protein
MKLQIISVHNHGDFKKEYVLLKVLEDCDVGNYVLADSTYTADGKVSNKVRHTFWFPDKEVKKGDLLSVWTGTGTNTSTKTDSGSPIHRFYWNLKTAVWNDDGDCAVLLELNTWQFFKTKE